MERVIIDVREPGEYAQGHVEGAINVPPAEIMKGSPQLKGIKEDTELVLYCISGSRSNVCSHILHQQGFLNVVNGINAQQVAAKYNLAIR